jgi:xanthine dehydrogenase accessory factor
VAEGQQALREGKPRLLRLGRFAGVSQGDDVVEYPMTCHSGGALEILIEPVLPAPRLIVVGETPVAATLAELARVMSYRMTLLDRASLLVGSLETNDAPGYVVVAAMGDDDETALAAALTAGVPYVALVASPRRATAVRETLAAMGVGRDDIARLKAPAGLDIGARTQQEIALSIMAEITQTQVTTAAAKDVVAEPAPAAEAIDPVCGMMVVIASAKHVSERDGQTWYFCCAGCRTRFETDPSQFTAA